MKTLSALRTARSGIIDRPIVHFRRRRSSVSPIQTVFEPSAFAASLQSIGIAVVARWWCGKFHSTPPEIHAPSMPIRAGLTTCWR